jgi:D-alanine-D-alanine ligase
LIEESGSDTPLPKPELSVGIIYNLKKGIHNHVVDAEAEYDNIETVHAIQRALEEGGIGVELMEADADLLDKLGSKKIDIAFNIAEGFNGRGREAQIPALLSMRGIPFTGSDETTLCIALDKALTKRLLATYKIRTPKYAVIKSGEMPRLEGFKYPVIVKPNAEGSSKGISDISVVRSKQELLELARRNLELYAGDMLAEEYIEGREFTVGLIGNNGDTRVFRPMEIIYKNEVPIPGGYNVYSYPVKQDYTRYVRYECPANLTSAQEEEMIKTSKSIYRALGCRDFARIDYRLASDGTLYFIEINPLPGLAPNYSDYPMLASFCGVDYGTLVRSLLKTALKRYGMSCEIK